MNIEGVEMAKTIPIIRKTALLDEWVWIGYDSKPKRNFLPEPLLAKTQEFINRLEDAGVSVHQKLIRKAWYEQ